MRKQDADCAAAVSHYDNAMAAVDATAGVRHEVFKWRMNTVSIRGNNLLEAGDTQRALKVLGDGHTLVMTHYGEGAHRHTIIDNLSLFRAYLAALVASGKVATATDMAVLPRETANDYHAEIDKSRDDKNKTSLILEAMLRSEELETGYGDALMARAHSLSATDSARTELHALAVQAYRIAIVWLRRADEQGYEMPFKNTNPVRFAHLNNSLGKALQATGDRQGAMTAHGLAYAAANCQSLKDNSMDEWDANSAVRPCNDAVSGYMSASGETQKRATEMAEVMYRQQMELYGTDISDLLRSRN